MSQRSKALSVLAVVLAAITSLPADAGERMHRHHGAQRIVVRNTVRIIDRSRTINVLARQRHRRQDVNTYSGDVAVYWRRGVGTWTYGSVGTPIETRAYVPNAKIIDLKSGKNDCSMENGVCVIRP
jgi:hypothetical protein